MKSRKNVLQIIEEDEKYIIKEIQFIKDSNKNNEQINNEMHNFINIVKEALPKMQINLIKKLSSNNNNFVILKEERMFFL